MDESLNFLPIFLVMAIAWLVPVVMANIKVIRIPAVIVEILLGFVVGKNVLNWIPDNPYMEFLSEAGFMFLLFMSGLSINVNQIVNSFPKKWPSFQRVVQNPLLASSLIYLSSLVLSYVAALGLATFVPIRDPLFLGIVIPTVALSIIVPVLKENGDLNEKHGQVIMLTGALSTMFSIILVSFYAGYVKNGLNFELLLFLIIFATFGLAIWLGKYILRIKPLVRLLYQLQHAASQIKVRGAIFLMLGFVMIAHLIEVELVLGAFLAGVVLSNYLSKERSSLIMKLDGMTYGFFVPIFFIMIGAELDLSALDQFDNSFVFLLLLLLAMFATQVLPTLLIAKVVGWQKALSSGIVLTCRLGLTIATAQIGLSLGVISPALNAALVIVAIITSLVSPLLYNLLSHEKSTSESKTIIIGASQAGVLLAERLQMHGKNVVIVDRNEEKCRELKRRGLPMRTGTGIDLELYKDLRLHPDDQVVVRTGSGSRNLAIAKLLKEKMGHQKIITEVNDPKLVKQVQLLEIEELNRSQIFASALENMLFRPSTFHHLFNSFSQFTVEDIKVSNKKIEGKTVQEMPFDKNGSLMVIRRNGNGMIPHGSTEIKLGDIVTVIGNAEAIDRFRGVFEKPLST